MRGTIRPPAAFVRAAHVSGPEAYEVMYRESLRSPERFWRKASEELAWFTPWKTLVRWKPPFAEWFLGGKLNVSYNCLDRHVAGPRRHKAALIWEGEPGERVVWTYQQLWQETCRLAHVLKNEGVQARDRVAIYMPMVPEAVAAMLACTRIGAVHTVVFGGFSAEALKDRINDCGACVVLTADGGFRRGEALDLKGQVDLAVRDTPTVRRVLVLRRTGAKVNTGPLDRWWHDAVAGASTDCPAQPLPSEHPLFVLYTSGSTGKPKGILHTTAGYLLGAHLSTRLVFDLKEEDLFWCTADIGWITGHTYVVYGALSNGATTLLYEGAPNHPRPDRFWDIIERHRVTIFYTAPTAIRAFMKWGEEHVRKHDLSSLRLLGSVGEPINPEAWRWYYQTIGGERCPIVDTWWQTETGSHMITTLPGACPMKPGSAGLPFFGVDAAVVDDAGREVPPMTQGKLVIRRPWPSMLRTIHGDATRYRRQYWSEVKGCYFTGDGAYRDADGYFWITGRIDDVLSVSGHRLGTAEVESALVSHPAVAESAVVGRPDEIKGQGLVAFVTLRTGHTPSAELKETLRQHVAKEIGSFAKPDEIRFTDALPKTRSGKIIRRLLKQVAVGATIQGDVTTLEDFSVLAKLSKEE